MNLQRKLLILPAPSGIRQPIRAWLNGSDIGAWDSLEVLSFHVDVLVDAMTFGLNPNAMDREKSLEAIRTGTVSPIEVPRVSGSEQNPAFGSTAGLLEALNLLGVQRLPILATAPAAVWLRANLGAEPAPGTWRIESEQVQ